MVLGGAGGTTNTGRGYVEAYCLLPGGGVKLPEPKGFSSQTLNELQTLVLTEDEANQDFDVFINSLQKDGCYIIDASATTKGQKFFSRPKELCLDGFDKSLVCLLTTFTTEKFECPNPSVIAIVTERLSSASEDYVNVGFSDDWDNVGRANGSPHVQMNVPGCSSTGLLRFETDCGSSRYNLFQEPTLSLGYGLFEDEPCGTYQSVDCKVGVGDTSSESLGFCNYVETNSPTRPPTASPTKSNKVGAAETPVASPPSSSGPDPNTSSKNPANGDYSAPEKMVFFKTLLIAFVLSSIFP